MERAEGQQAHSPGHHPGWLAAAIAPCIQRLHANAFALSGRTSSLHHTQGDALGYALVAPSGRALNACAYSLIQLAKLE